jgi:hypothetical protein
VTRSPVTSDYDAIPGKFTGKEFDSESVSRLKNLYIE